MAKKLPANRLSYPNFAGQQHSIHNVILPPGDVFEDLFAPQYWSHHDRTLRHLDLVRVLAADNSFDVMLTVRAKVKGGAVMEPWPKYPPGIDGTNAEALARHIAEVRPTTVPILPGGKLAIRVDYTEVTKWRVIGLNESILSQDHQTKEEAEAEMGKYLKVLGLALPPPEAVEAVKDAARKAREEDTERRKGARRTAA